MTLILDPSETQQGLWFDPKYQPGRPATFAVVIGVSQYRHLAGGPEAIKDNSPDWLVEARDFGQLHVSALTAFRVFSWLRSTYRFEDAPLAYCWLLLAPTPEEIPLLTLDGQPVSYAEPTFQNCERAVTHWFGAMRQVPAAAGTNARGLFFFTGHGLEITQERQVLLPTDWLNPPAHTVDRALSTQNLRNGVGSLPVDCQLFFVDACRNDHKTLRGKNIQGTRLLTEDESAAVNPRLATPTLYAAAPGQRAWEHRDPSKGISIFGQALLDGLMGQPDISLDCSGERCAVQLFPLQKYLKSRVLELLRDAGSTQEQFVKLGGTPEDVAITFVSPSVSQGRPPKGPPPMHTSIIEGTPLCEMAAKGAFSDLWVTDFNEADRLFGSERVIELWGRSRVWALGQRTWKTRSVLKIRSVERDKARGRYRVRLAIADSDPQGYWLTFQDDLGDTHACMLPSVGRLDREYELVMERAGEISGKRAITRLEAAVPVDEEALGEAADLWRRYSTEGVGAALEELDAARLKRLVRAKLGSPLGAAVAALVLVRGRRLQNVPDQWLENLANWFPELPDCLVLSAISKLTRGAPDANDAAAQQMARLGDAGMPMISEVFGLAIDVADRLTAGRGVSSLQDLQVRVVRDQLVNAATYFRPGGLFSNFSYLPLEGTPESIWTIKADGIRFGDAHVRFILAPEELKDRGVEFPQIRPRFKKSDGSDGPQSFEAS